MKIDTNLSSLISRKYFWIAGIILSFFIGALGITRVSAYPISSHQQTRSRLCGKLIFLDDAKTGAKLIGLKSCDGGELFIFGQHPRELYNYYQFTDAIVESGTPTSTQMGKISKYITGWSGYIQINSCSECGSTSPGIPLPPPTLTSLPPTATPTTLPTVASPMLEVSSIQIEPSQVSVFEMTKIILVIENRGLPLNQPSWGYMGEVLLENENGEPIEKHYFSKGDSSSIVLYNEGGQLILEKWRITVKVRFTKVALNGRVIVSLLPNLQPQSVLRGEGKLSIYPGLSGVTCTSVIVNKLVGPFSPDIKKDLLDAITSELQAANCEESDLACAVPPLVKGFIKILGRGILGEVGKIITGIWGVFDTDALQVCRSPILTLFQLVREFNRQGVPISVSGIHSPMTILVINSNGQRAGFVFEDEVVTEIPNSQVIEWEGEKYVIYPPSPDITISLQATGDGTVNVSLIDGQSGREVSYDNIPVTDGNKAQIDLSDPQDRLVLDTNNDGNPDETYTPGAIEMLLPVSEMPAVYPPPTNPTSPTTVPPRQRSIPCIGGLFILLLPLAKIIYRL